MGVSPDSRRNERLLVDAPSLQLQFSIPAASVEEAPHLNGEERKLPRRWVEEHLHLIPMGGDVSGVGVYASRLPPHLKKVGRSLGRGCCASPPVSLTREHRATQRLPLSLTRKEGFSSFLLGIAPRLSSRPRLDHSLMTLRSNPKRPTRDSVQLPERFSTSTRPGIVRGGRTLRE